MYQQFQKIIITLGLLSMNLIASAQDGWSLERCVQHVQQNSREVKQALLNVESARLMEKQDRLSRHPNLNANTNYGVQLGRTIDPTTNTFNNQSIGSNSLSLNTSVTLYNGGRINNSIKQDQFNVQAAQADAEATSNNLALMVAQHYLQIMLSEDNLENARKRQKLTQEQLERTDKLIKAGSLAQSSRLDIVAQLARDEQNVVIGQNNVEINYLNLKQLLQLDPDANFKIERPKVSIPETQPEAFGLKAIYTQALGIQPQIRAGNFRLKAAEKGVDIARSGLLPSLFLQAGFNSYYSTAAQNFTNPDLSGIQLVPNNSNVLIDGTNATLTTFQPTGIVFPKVGYLEQIGQNFGQNIGIGLNIPIYNNGNARIGMQRAQLSIEQQRLTNAQQEQQLKSDIQLAITNARSAKKQYEAAQKTYEAAKATFENTDKRLQIGSVNTFEYTTAKSNLDTAETDLTISKYDYIFKLKIVDFYQGKRLMLQ